MPLFSASRSIGESPITRCVSVHTPRLIVQNNESQADNFALRMMRRLNLPPFGAVIYFLAASYISPMPVDFESQKDWEIHVRRDATHPFTPSRMDALADLFERDAGELAGMEKDSLATVRMNQTAVQIRGIADTLRDRDLQLLIRQRGIWADARSLQPQRWEPIQDLGRSFPDDRGPKSITQKSAVSAAVKGEFVGKFTTHGAGRPSRMTTRLEATDDRVRGTYEYGKGDSKGTGTLEGIRRGDVMYLRWKEGTVYYGRATFSVESQGEEIVGTWGYKESDRDGGKWDGVRE